MTDFAETHAALRTIMLGVAEGLVVARDAPGTLEVRTAMIDARTGHRGWFGTVAVKISYVAYHLIPLYDRPELAENLSPALKKRRQGKTCFNFKAVDAVVFEELAELTRRVRGLLP